MKILKLPFKPKIISLPLPKGLFDLFKKIEPKSKNAFFFESLGPNNDHLSRYSIMGFDPELVIVGNKNSLRINNREIKTLDPYASLCELMPQSLPSEEFLGGLVGYFSYEAINLFEPELKLKTGKNFDLFRFGFYTDGVIFDHLTGEAKYFYYRKNHFNILLSALKRESGNLANPKIKKVRKVVSPTQHGVLVNQVLKEIQAGNVFQCEVGLRKNCKVLGSFLPIYEKLRDINPSPYLYYEKFGKQVLLGSSPELLLSVNNGQMETFPLAGTVKRGKSVAEDQRLAKELLNDKKEQAEHKMLVDLHRNDLGRVAKFGTVMIKKFMDIKKFSHVQHISSEISGLLKAGENMFTAFKSCFPAGTLTGAPKIESMKIINRQEKQPRGPYGGAVGFFGFNGNCEFAIPIRSLFANGNKAYIQACGGIVYDSQISAEYQEISNKLKAMELALDSFKEAK